MHVVRTIGFGLNETKHLVGEVSVEKLFKYYHKDVYHAMKRNVEVVVYESSFLVHFSQLCTENISVNALTVYLPIEKQEEFVTRLKAILENELIHVSALSEFLKLQVFKRTVFKFSKNLTNQ